jgi:ribosomal protein S18 acetylase RimI-like enzyme
MASVDRTRTNPITVRRLGIDDFSNVRYLHITAMTAQSIDALSEAEVAAFAAFVRSPAYTDALVEEESYGALVDSQLVGTASWQFNGDDGHTARVSSVFVDPLFCRLGIGSRLLGEVEKRAFQSGFRQLGASVTSNAVPFFERLGYREASRGVKALGPGCSIPVVFMRKRIPRLVRVTDTTH